MIVTNDQGNTYGLGNPVKDAFVRQFMRGLKKRKSTEITQRQATPISLDMLRVLHSHLAIAPGFTEASLEESHPRSGAAEYFRPDVSFTYGADKLEGRKTEVAEGRCNYMHQRESNGLLIDDMADVRTNEDGSQLERQRLRFPSAVQNLEERYQDGRLFYCCENARVEWGKKMSEQAFITLLNLLFEISIVMGVHAWVHSTTMVRHLVHLLYVPPRWCPARFMFAPPERRWSLRMVKWWAEWTQNESAETLVRYLLDQAATDEDTQLADCLAPDRDLHVGCPTTFSRRKRNTTEPARQLSSSIEKWLKTVENSVKALEARSTCLSLLFNRQTNGLKLNTRERDQSDECRKISILPPAKDWKDMYQCIGTLMRRVIYSSMSVSGHLWRERRVSTKCCQVIAEDVRDFAIQKGVLSPRNAADSTLSTYAVYYTEHWLKDTAELNVLTIDTLARYIRLDRKRRLVKSKHSYM
ncbi:hypothetical protein GQ600_25835 [Phytophthora cactorum]|nr:hypothetical protein GQ600_25835 [Phytophthora cactorum]